MNLQIISMVNDFTLNDNKWASSGDEDGVQYNRVES